MGIVFRFGISPITESRGHLIYFFYVEEPSAREMTRLLTGAATEVLRLRRSTNVLRRARERTKLTASARTPRRRHPAARRAGPPMFSLASESLILPVSGSSPSTEVV